MGNLGHYGMTVRFDSTSDQNQFLEDIKGASLLASRFGTDHVYQRYEVSRFGFAREIQRLLLEKGITSSQQGELALEKLHTNLPEDAKALDESELNSVSRAFYETDDRFLRLYYRFVKEVVGPAFGADLYFQQTPTIRFQFPGQAGFTWNPRIHTDIMLGHPPHEVNIWIPLTRVYGTNSMMIARMDDSMRILEELGFDFEKFAYRVQCDAAFWQRCADVSKPVTMEYGSMLMFDPRCLHATQYNTTADTRVSMDIRVIRREDMEQMKLVYRGTGRKRLQFAPGHYYYANSCVEV